MFVGYRVAAQDSTEGMNRAVSQSVRAIEESLVRFETIGGLDRADGAVTNSGPSTGLAVSENGFVISASINFSHQPTAIFARLADGTRVAAEIVSRDTSRNLVLLKIDSSVRLRVPKSIARSQLRVGQTAIAVGKAYQQDRPNVSTGIVSATQRVWGKAIQTDAKISRANYGGPLIDLQGRVIGILVPLDPNDDGQQAGTQWYDSGIGFAAPLDELMPRIKQMKSGKSLRPGLLGITLKGTDIYSDPAVIEYCPNTSPAWEAGLRPGDEIVDFGGHSITRQTQFKHAIGPLYESDAVRVSVERDGELLRFDIELAGEIEPYQPVGIGLIPSNQKGAPLVIRHVLNDSSAERANIMPGDEVISITGRDVATWQEARSRLAGHISGELIHIGIRRDNQSIELEVSIDKQSARTPTVLNSPRANAIEPEDSKLVEIAVAGSANQCVALIPDANEQDGPAGVIVWIPEPGKIDRTAYTKHWREGCSKRNLILLVPQSLNANRWRPDESEMIASAIELLAKRHRLNPNRITIGGTGAGAAMASLVVSQRRDLIQGLILLNAGLPARVAKIETAPNQPLLVLMAVDSPFEGRSNYSQTVARLHLSKLPFAIEKQESAALSDWIPTIARWSDSVDRL